MYRISESLIFPNRVTWDNSLLEDKKCAGRYWAALKAPTTVVYFQDDDVIVPPETQRALLQAYRPGVCVATWGHGVNADGYDDLPLVCGGAIVDGDECWKAISRYAKYFPLDEAFMYEADFVVGVLYDRFEHIGPTNGEDLMFEINMPVAQDPSRLCNQEWQKELKLKITEQARWVRDHAA